MYKIYSDSELKDSLVRRGVAHVKSFSWDESARSHLSLFNEVLHLIDMSEIEAWRTTDAGAEKMLENSIRQPSESGMYSLVDSFTETWIDKSSRK